MTISTIKSNGPAHPTPSSAGCGPPGGHALQRSRSGVGGASLLEQDAPCTTRNAGN